MRSVVIMAGGSGKRLWPLSRRDTPKQLLPLLGEQSLLRVAFDRVRQAVPDERVFVCTGAEWVDVVAKELPELPVANILGEPSGRDSLNAVAWPAAVLAHEDPDAVVAMVTADHLIEPVDSFVEALLEAFAVAEAEPDALVTFGVPPTSPHTGYGYLHRGEPVPGREDVFTVREFKEKPDAETAAAYLASGEYWWNSGMFVWRAATLLRQLEVLQPDCHRIVTTLAREPGRLEELYPQLPRTSVDYAVMEPVSQGRASGRVLVVKLPISWHDVGGYASLLDRLERDASGNAVRGLSVQVDGRNNLVINDQAEHLVATIGVSDMIIVATRAITLVCPLGESERVKELVAAVTDSDGRYA
ncbi:NTP transferase domain-containing protein [Auraticoccus sp. F435]|uniref:NTP transferase domain-containing protein n=1 Tax=Auraticoccus cholistanensis TaxID=2656650 RepID=A0A6A9UYN0_9ACTN|nr:mannose-1-phosphate guanylyltransferase [Auraticoccus cholistanensis]MVA76707.1 NTP transferase domain-containing protein [Auraticoccus cholistanensis]